MASYEKTIDETKLSETDHMSEGSFLQKNNEYTIVLGKIDNDTEIDKENEKSISDIKENLDMNCDTPVELQR